MALQIDTTFHGGPAYTGHVQWANGSFSTLARRERPQVLLRYAEGGSFGASGVPEIICTSAQAVEKLGQDGKTRYYPDGGLDVPEECRSFTMCEAVAL